MLYFVLHDETTYKVAEKKEKSIDLNIDSDQDVEPTDNDGHHVRSGAEFEVSANM